MKSRPLSLVPLTEEQAASARADQLVENVADRMITLARMLPDMRARATAGSIRTLTDLERALADTIRHFGALAVVLLVLAGCGGPEGAVTLSKTFELDDVMRAEGIIHKLVPEAGTLHYSAAEVPSHGEMTWGWDVTRFGGTYRIELQPSDCLFHTYFMVALLHVAYAEAYDDYNAEDRPGFDRVVPSRYDCRGFFHE